MSVQLWAEANQRKGRGQGASWMSQKRQDDPNAACSPRFQQAKQQGRQRRRNVRGLHVPGVGSNILAAARQLKAKTARVRKRKNVKLRVKDARP